MKKVFATLALLSVMTVMTFTPKTAQAEDSDCYTHIMCGNYVIICNAYDYVVWDEIFCGLSEE